MRTENTTKNARVAQKKGTIILKSSTQYRGMTYPPTDPILIKNIASMFLEWSQDPSVMSWKKFPLDRAWNPYKFSQLAEKCEYFENIFRIVKERISQRIEEQARAGRADQKIDMAWVKEFLPMYSDEYKRQRSEIVTARIEGNRNTQTTINVITEPIPDPKDNK